MYCLQNYCTVNLIKDLLLDHITFLSKLISLIWYLQSLLNIFFIILATEFRGFLYPIFIKLISAFLRKFCQLKLTNFLTSATIDFAKSVFNWNVQSWITYLEAFLMFWRSFSLPQWKWTTLLSTEGDRTTCLTSSVERLM